MASADTFAPAAEGDPRSVVHRGALRCCMLRVVDCGVGGGAVRAVVPGCGCSWVASWLPREDVHGRDLLAAAAAVAPIAFARGAYVPGCDCH